MPIQTLWWISASDLLRRSTIRKRMFHAAIKSVEQLMSLLLNPVREYNSAWCTTLGVSLTDEPHRGACLTLKIQPCPNCQEVDAWYCMLPTLRIEGWFELTKQMEKMSGRMIDPRKWDSTQPIPAALWVSSWRKKDLGWEYWSFSCLVSGT